tara:strand:+ start:1102 stop:1845 length:744 start_codon:yes stop_codon:yes gene_type:complete
MVQFAVAIFLIALWPHRAAAEMPDLTGSWYLTLRTSTNAKVPIIGNTNIKSTTHLLVSIKATDAGLAQTQQTCVVDNRPSRSITRTVLPKAFIDHLPIKTYPISVTAEPDGSVAYYADLVQQFVGYDGAKANGVIPSRAKDPAVYDWDEDGKPGASVLVDIPIIGHVRIYMVQTNHTVLTGTVRSANKVEGRTKQLLLKQRTIGADNRLLAANPKLTVAEGHNDFELVRIEPGSTCTDIARMAKGRF